MSFFKKFIFFTLITLSLQSLAENDSFSYDVLEKVDASNSFIAPNELFPYDANPLFEKSPIGARISVGTERGFLAASFDKNTNELYLVDRDPIIMKYNYYNRILLKIAPDRSTYLKLRLESPSELLSSLLNQSSLSSDEIKFITNHENQNWWKENVTNNSKFSLFHSDVKKSQADPAFKNSNYLFDDKLFDKVSKLAKEEKIHIIKADFSSDEDLTKLIEILKNNNSKISTADVSNVIEYLSEKERMNLANKLSEVSDKNSSLVFSAIAPIYKDNIPIELLLKRNKVRGWIYHGASFDYLKNHPTYFSDENFAKTQKGRSLIKEIAETYNGKSIHPQIADYITKRAERLKIRERQNLPSTQIDSPQSSPKESLPLEKKSTVCLSKKLVALFYALRKK